MSILGVDIGSDTIKVVEMAGGKGRLKLLNYGITPTPPGAVLNGDIQDAEMVADALKQLVKTRKIASKQVVSCVQGQQSVVVRIIEIPRMGKAELADTMKFEIERHIPFPANQIILDYTVLQRPGEPNDTPNMEVLFGVAQEETINVHVAAIKGAKLKPKAIDVQPLALGHSLVERSEGTRGLGETVAVVNIGSNVTDLCIIKDGILHFPRTIMVGGRSVTQRLSEGLGVSEQQAERLKRQYGSLAPLPPHLAAFVGQQQAAAEGDAAPAAEAPAAAALDFGADLFTLEPDENSDVGFGGTGAATGFEAPADEPLVERFVEEEEAGRTPFSLSEGGGDAGDLFDLGVEMKTPTKPEPPPSAAAPAPDPAAESDQTFLFDFGDSPAAESATGESAPPAASQDDTFVFDFGASAPPGAGAVTAPSEEHEFEFEFDLASEPGAPAGAGGEGGDEDSFVFDFGGAGESSLSTATAGSSTSPSAQGGSTFGFGGDQAPSGELEASYDLGFLATETGDSGPDLEAVVSSLGDSDLSGLDDLESDAGPAEAPETLTPEDEELLRVRDVISPVVSELVQEVQRSLDYYRSRYEGAVVDRVTLVGGTARMPGLAEYFEHELGITVDNGDPLDGVTIASSKLSDAELAQDAPLLAVAVGLAMRELC